MELKFKAPEHAIAYKTAFQTALERGFDPEEGARDVITCLQILNELSLN